MVSLLVAMVDPPVDYELEMAFIRYLIRAEKVGFKMICYVLLVGGS